MTSAIASRLRKSTGWLLPVSTVETPSISVLLDPPPPSRPGLLPLMSTPGASEVRLVKLRLLIGRFWTESVATVNDRSPVCD